MLTVFHNLSNQSFRHDKLKKLWNNEVDILIIDPDYGVFAIEIKSKCYGNLKKSTNKKYSLAKEVEKQTKRHALFNSIRSYSVALCDVPIHTLLLCNAMPTDATKIMEVMEYLSARPKEIEGLIELIDFLIRNPNIVRCLLDMCFLIVLYNTIFLGKS